MVVSDVTGVPTVVVSDVEGVPTADELSLDEFAGDWLAPEEAQAASAMLAIKIKLNNMVNLDLLLCILILHTSKVRCFYR